MKHVRQWAALLLLVVLFIAPYHGELQGGTHNLCESSLFTWHPSVHLDMSLHSIVLEEHPEQGKVKELRIYNAKKHLLRCFTHHASSYSIDGLVPGVYLLVVDYGFDAYVQAIEIPKEGVEEMPYTGSTN